MLHYHVWFNLQPGVDETRGLAIVSGYLAQLTATAETAGFVLLKNQGAPPKSKLPMYHALVMFSDFAQLNAAMKHQSQRGIHHGGHGEIIRAVCDFHVEIFSSVTGASESSPANVLGAGAGET